MKNVRSFFFASLLLAAPVGAAFAQGAPSKSAAPPATTAKSSAQPATTAAPTATTKASAAPTIPAPDAAAQREIATEVDAAMNEKAQALFKEGNSYFREGKYAKAQASYMAAFALDLRNQRIVNNLGLTELELKLYRDAAEHLTIALRLSPPNDPKRAAIERNLAEVRARVGAVKLSIKHGGQELDGVEIVDLETGKKYDTPLLDPVFVEAKKVGFRIRREGYESQEKVFDLKPGEETSAEIILERPANYVPGGPAGTGTTSTTTTRPRSKLPGFIGLGVGGVAMVVGGVLVGLATGVPGEIESEVPKEADGTWKCKRTAQPAEEAICADLRAKADSGSTMGNVGVGVLVGGGVVAAAAVVYLLLPSAKPGAGGKSGTIVPMVGQTGGGLLWTGSF